MKSIQLLLLVDWCTAIPETKAKCYGQIQIVTGVCDQTTKGQGGRRKGLFLVHSDAISGKALSQSRMCAGSKPCVRAAVAAATTRDDGQHTASAGGGAKVASDALPRLAKPRVCRIRSSSDSSQQQQAPSAAAGRQAGRQAQGPGGRVIIKAIRGVCSMTAGAACQHHLWRRQEQRVLVVFCL